MQKIEPETQQRERSLESGRPQSAAAKKIPVNNVLKIKHIDDGEDLLRYVVVALVLVGHQVIAELHDCAPTRRAVLAKPHDPQ